MFRFNLITGGHVIVIADSLRAALKLLRISYSIKPSRISSYLEIE